MKDTKARLCPPVRSNLPHEVEQGDEKFSRKKVNQYLTRPVSFVHRRQYVANKLA